MASGSRCPTRHTTSCYCSESHCASQVGSGIKISTYQNDNIFPLPLVKM